MNIFLNDSSKIKYPTKAVIINIVKNIKEQYKESNDKIGIAKEKPKQINNPIGKRHAKPFLGLKYRKKKHSASINSSIKIGRYTNNSVILYIIKHLFYFDKIPRVRI